MSDVERYYDLSAVEQLNYFRGQYYNDGSDTERGIVANAINELLPKLDKILHLKAIPYTLEYSSKLFDDRVAVFDDRMVTEEEVHRYIRSGGYDSRILDMSKKQFESIFNSSAGRGE